MGREREENRGKRRWIAGKGKRNVWRRRRKEKKMNK